MSIRLKRHIPGETCAATEAAAALVGPYKRWNTARRHPDLYRHTRLQKLTFFESPPLQAYSRRF